MGRSFTPSGGASTPFEGQELLSSFTPPPLPANTNDYTVNQRAFVNASVLQIAATAAINLTGLQGANPNRELLLVNVGASTITLKNASGLSQAPNRFAFGADVALAQNQAIKLLGLAAGGWGLVGTGTSGAAPAPATATYVTVANETATLPNSVEFSSLAIAAAIYSTNSQVIPDSTATAVIVDTPLFDVGALWSNANPTRLTAPAAGLYLATASILWNAAASGVVGVSFAVNGVHGTPFGLASVPSSAAITPGVALSYLFQLAAGDYIEAIAIQTSGANLDILGQERYTAIGLMAVH